MVLMNRAQLKLALPVTEFLEELTKAPLPAGRSLSAPVNSPLPAAKSPKSHRGSLANGRNSKALPSFDKWFCQVFPSEIAAPAWRSMTKTATDVVTICRAKAGRAAKAGEKDSSGRPIFDFTVSEAEVVFKLTPPTFTKAIRLLLHIGFIEYSRPGGMVNGTGVKALYRLSDKWQSWQPPRRDNTNITKARAARKQKPSQEALNSIDKEALSRDRPNVIFVGKAAFNENAYHPV